MSSLGSLAIINFKTIAIKKGGIRPLRTQLASAEDVLPMRTRHREEMNCQIVHDSIHRRPGWTLTYRLEVNDTTAGYGAVAVAGPWKDRPTLLEFYVLPEHRALAFGLFEMLLAVSNPQCFEIQSNDVLPFIMAHTYGSDIVSEKIVFHDAGSTAHSSRCVLVRITSEAESKQCLEQRAGSSDWMLELDGTPIGRGGFAFHYNRPYADVYMEIDEPYRRRGFATYLVQELKRECYAMGAVPASRCSPGNAASYRTLQRAGFTPLAHILVGTLSGNHA
jgi:GNAT superfamily N-acetyltransferase